MILKDEFGYKIFQKLCKLYPEISYPYPHQDDIKSLNGKGFVRNTYKKINGYDGVNNFNGYTSLFFQPQNFPKFT